MSSTPSSGSTLTSCRFSDPAAVCVASQSSALSSTEPSSFWPTTRARTHSGPVTLELAIHASVSPLIVLGCGRGVKSIVVSCEHLAEKFFRDFTNLRSAGVWRVKL
jgi:hypothetical protein